MSFSAIYGHILYILRKLIDTDISEFIMHVTAGYRTVSLSLSRCCSNSFASPHTRSFEISLAQLMQLRMPNGYNIILCIFACLFWLKFQHKQSANTHTHTAQMAIIIREIEALLSWRMLLVFMHNYFSWRANIRVLHVVGVFGCSALTTPCVLD